MDDLEFQVIDELYFVTPYDELEGAVDIDKNELNNTLHLLIEKHWVRVYVDNNIEIEGEEINFESEYMKYSYLATKAGLFAHNGR